MKIHWRGIAAALLLSALGAGVSAQPMPFNEAGVTMGHWHLNSLDIGFIVQNVQEAVARWKAAGVPVVPGNNNRLDQAYVNMPDGLRIEVLEDKAQQYPIQHEHVHFFLPESVIPQSQAWYAKHFGAKPGVRNDAPVADLPGVQLRFAKTDKALVPTRGRILDHIGFDVKDLKAFLAKLEADGIKIERPYTFNEKTGEALAFISDPWGVSIELNQRRPR